MKITVYEDNKGRTDALKLLFQDYPEIEVLGFFANCENVIYETRTLLPDLILMDINMPIVNGIEGTRIVRQNFPNVIIIMQTIFEDETNIFNAIQAGAQGYILKSTSTTKLIEAIKEAHEGGAPMTPSIARRVIDAFRKPVSIKKEEVFVLSEKENSILELLSKGMSYKQIAVESNISYHTVNSHIKKIYEKLHVNSATEAIVKFKRL
jgi:DNA-binding NarL/FixJ family response regulator